MQLSTHILIAPRKGLVNLFISFLRRRRGFFLVRFENGK